MITASAIIKIAVAVAAVVIAVAALIAGWRHLAALK